MGYKIMGKVISTTSLRSHLSSLLDELESGETHFIVRRNNRSTAVLLNWEKFQEIMQMLELLNGMDFIESGNLMGSHPFDETPHQFPETLPGSETVPAPGQPNGRTSGESIETVAARLGIRLIK